VSSGSSASDVRAPRLEVCGASVRYDERLALDAVDLAVAPGEVVAVLGPSGSGKSTLLRAVAGLVPLAAGTIRLSGRDVAGVPVHRRGVGLMFQEHALFPHRDVAGNVGFGLRVAGAARADVRRRVDELLELVGLPGAGARPVHELSGGEQQRVALARALAPAPEVLLLDEPLGALDRTLRERLVAELRRLFTAHALTVVAVTHDQGEAFALADRIAIVDGGRVVQAGAPAEVWAAPRTRRAAALLGLGNVIEGEVERSAARTAWGSLPVPTSATGRVVLVVRPEGVRIVARGGVAARVRERTFRGPTTSLDVELVDGSGPALQAEVPSAIAPERGDVVRVRIDPGAVVVVDP
jgi:thiamine transport system ATP-binding protein